MARWCRPRRSGDRRQRRAAEARARPPGSGAAGCCPGGSSATPRRTGSCARHRRSRQGRGGNEEGKPPVGAAWAAAAGVLVLSGARSPRPVQTGAEGPAVWGGMAAGARGAGGRWRDRVEWRPAREALEAAGARGSRSHLSCMMPSSAAGSRWPGEFRAGRRQAGGSFVSLRRGRAWWMDIHPDVEALARGREPCGARCAADGPVPRSGGVLLEERGT